MKNHNVYKSQSIYKTNCTRSQHKEECRCSSLMFPNITREDSERYVCRVTMEIPTYATYEGNGTLISVMAKENSDSPEEKNEKGPKELGSDSDEVLVYVLRCLPILALVGTFFYLNNRRSRPQQHAPDGPGDKNTSVTMEEKDEEQEESDDTATKLETAEERM
ncbi:uncharacterized protein LOC117505128 [Thalassophryne amazonica]|uniref:uncharacterized protein LOC117505128 n=1 Tax=Thalassophryne amazonica TaxID=390379 RepID=UPI0014726B5B|nr:uncharacterized protein LOC117505128 [Thalassophryne amazonica]